MFKNLTMYVWSTQEDDDSFFLRRTLVDSGVAEELIALNPPTNPDFGQVSKSGLLPVDPLIIEQSVGSGIGFLPLTQVIRERVVDKGAVTFEVNQRIATILQRDRRVVGKKERQQITEDVFTAMLKDAPIREKRVFGIVTLNCDILVNATGKAAEDYISYLRSLFGNGNIYIRQLDLHSVTKIKYEDVFSTDPFTHFALELMNQVSDLHLNNDEVLFESGGSFAALLGGKEKLCIEHVCEGTLSDVWDRISENAAITWIALKHEHATFKLTSELTLKSIKLEELDYTPDNNEEAGLSAAYYRFYLNFMRTLFNEVAETIVLANQGGKEDV